MRHPLSGKLNSGFGGQEQVGSAWFGMSSTRGRSAATQSRRISTYRYNMMNIKNLSTITSAQKQGLFPARIDQMPRALPGNALIQSHQVAEVFSSTGKQNPLIKQTTALMPHIDHFESKAMNRIVLHQNLSNQETIPINSQLGEPLQPGEFATGEHTMPESVGRGTVEQGYYNYNTTYPGNQT